MRDGLRRPEEAPKGGKSQAGRAGAGSQGPHHDLKALPEVPVSGVATAGREAPQAFGRVIAEVAVAGLGWGPGVKEHLSILGHEEEDEPVHEAQELPVVILAVEGAGSEVLAQDRVGGVGEEARAESLEGPLHPAPEGLEGPHPLLPGDLAPALQDAGLGWLALEARDVADEPKDSEVGVDLAREHGLEVELDVGLASEGGVVPQQAQDAPVGDEAVEPLLGVVEELLEESVGALGGGPRHTPLPPVKIGSPSKEVDGDLPPGVGDSVAFAVQLHGAGWGESAVAELCEERQEPALAGEAGGAVRFREPGQLFLERPPGAEEAVPGAGDGLVKAVAAVQVVGLGLKVGEARIAGRHPGKEVWREDPALGADGGEAFLACAHG
ncbi:hypothetical protein A7Q09_05355 [Methylacidiphilum sp. Yel]|nr:hypothetical protein A7Q09_05355 [Methylacidiphilum sp. Yel]